MSISNTADKHFEEFGQAGRRLVELNAAEGAAGNISCCLAEDEAQTIETLKERFTHREQITLPVPASALAGRWLLATGSGQRLRDLARDPLAGLGLLQVQADGQMGELYTAPQREFSRLTSEFNSHLAVHADQALANGKTTHYLVHAQPPYLTYLSHLPRYQQQDHLNQALMRWQPETILTFPTGFGVLPFLLPGSPALMQANVEKLQKHNLVIWSKHGVMARSPESLLKCVDAIEYAEAAARYEYLHLLSGNRQAGLTPDEIQQISQAYGVSQTLF